VPVALELGLIRMGVESVSAQMGNACGRRSSKPTPRRPPTFAVPCGPRGVCSANVAFLPHAVLPRQPWEQLKAEAHTRGISEYQLQELFIQLCNPSDRASLGTVRVVEFCDQFRAHYQPLLRRFVRLQAGGRSPRIKFEDLARMIMDLCSMDYFTLVVVATRVIAGSDILDHIGVRAIVRYIHNKPLDPLVKALCRLMTCQSDVPHRIPAVAVLFLRYPCLGFPLLQLQRALQRRFWGAKFWEEYQRRNHSLLYPVSLTFAGSKVLAARQLALELLSSKARPFVFGDETTVAVDPALLESTSMADRAEGTELEDGFADEYDVFDAPPPAKFEEHAAAVHGSDPWEDGKAIRKTVAYAAELRNNRAHSDMIAAAQSPTARKATLTFDSTSHAAASLLFSSIAGGSSKTEIRRDISLVVPMPVADFVPPFVRDNPPPTKAPVVATSVAIAKHVLTHFVSGVGSSCWRSEGPCLLCGESLTGSLPAPPPAQKKRQRKPEVPVSKVVPFGLECVAAELPQDREFTNAGACTKCEVYLGRAMVDVFGYAVARTVVSAMAITLPLSTEISVTAAQAAKEKQPILPQQDDSYRAFSFVNDVEVELFDDAQGRFFYYNIATGTSSWKRPARYIPYEFVPEDYAKEGDVPA
jgi:hypothetical protein